MRFPKSSLFALSILACLAAVGADAAIIKAAGKAGTTTTATKTPGQKTILMNIDPYNVSSFQLDVMFEADKVQFVGVRGTNGYLVDSESFTVTTEGSFGYIDNIFGFWPGFDPRVEVLTAPPLTNALLPIGPAGELPLFPPPGAQNIFQVEFLDLREDLDKRFDTLAGDTDDFIEGVDPQTGRFTTAAGPDNVSPSFAIIPGIAPGDPNGGGTAVPLPPALVMGLFGAAGVLGNAAIRNRRNAA